MILDPLYCLSKIKRLAKARFEIAKHKGELNFVNALRSVTILVVLVLLLSFGTSLVNPIGSAEGEHPSPRPVLIAGAALPPKITARSAFLIDMKSGYVLYDKNSLLELLPASTTKIATALVALANYELDDVAKVPASCSFSARAGESLMGLFPEENISVRNLLQGLLIASGSDAACVLAKHHGGGEVAFVAAMNNLAATLGLERTHFVNPSGMDDPAHYATAQELTFLAEKALENEYFRQVVGMKEANVSSTDGRRWHKLETTNKLLKDMPGVLGVKTGYTAGARETFVFYFQKANIELLGTVLASNNRFEDAKALLSWALSSFLFL